MSRNKIEYAISALMNAPVNDDKVAFDIRRAVDWLQEALTEYPEQPSPLVRTLAKDLYMARQRRDFWKTKLQYIAPDDAFRPEVVTQEAYAAVTVGMLEMLVAESGVGKEVDALIKQL